MHQVLWQYKGKCKRKVNSSAQEWDGEREGAEELHLDWMLQVNRGSLGFLHGNKSGLCLEGCRLSGERERDWCIASLSLEVRELGDITGHCYAAPKLVWNTLPSMACFQGLHQIASESLCPPAHKRNLWVLPFGLSQNKMFSAWRWKTQSPGLLIHWNVNQEHAVELFQPTPGDTSREEVGETKYVIYRNKVWVVRRWREKVFVGGGEDAVGGRRTQALTPVPFAVLRHLRLPLSFPNQLCKQSCSWSPQKSRSEDWELGRTVNSSARAWTAGVKEGALGRVAIFFLFLSFCFCAPQLGQNKHRKERLIPKHRDWFVKTSLLPLSSGGQVNVLRVSVHHLSRCFSPLNSTFPYSGKNNALQITRLTGSPSLILPIHTHTHREKDRKKHHFNLIANHCLKCTKLFQVCIFYF